MNWRTRVALTALLVVALGCTPVAAQKSGGTLRIYNSTNPPSASPHEDTTIAVVMPFMAVYNNLVRYDPAKPHDSFDTIVPELATSWNWDVAKTKLTFNLHSNVLADYRDFVRSFFSVADGRIGEFIQRALVEEARLWPEALLQVSPSYARVASVDELAERGVLLAETARVSRVSP